MIKKIRKSARFKPVHVPSIDISKVYAFHKITEFSMVAIRNLRQVLDALSQNLQTYREAKLIKLFFSYKADLIWIFVASSVVNLLMLTPMLYMLQIFDRIFISESVITLFTVSSIIIFFILFLH